MVWSVTVGLVIDEDCHVIGYSGVVGGDCHMVGYSGIHYTGTVFL